MRRPLLQRNESPLLTPVQPVPLNPDSPQEGIAMSCVGSPRRMGPGGVTYSPPARTGILVPLEPASLVARSAGDEAAFITGASWPRDEVGKPAERSHRPRQ